MFSIDLMSRIPIYEQIVNQLEDFVLKEIVLSGDQIPSVRSLSLELSTNPNTIQKAYSELDRRGIIHSVPGKGCFVTMDAKSVLSKQKLEKVGDFMELTRELLLAGVPKATLFDRIEEVYSEEKNAYEGTQN